MFNTTKRPRNVDAISAAAILYGDWGTSKAYVIGLAFALAGYSSFWIIFPVSILCILVGLNYITICRLYPNGGGVYASVRHRSQVISLIGAFFLFADYLVTASLSALAAFTYLGIQHPVLWASLAIAAIGALNFLGPKNTGKMAFYLSIPTFIIVVLLGILSIPHLGTAIEGLRPLKGNFWTGWNGFVGVILALSGIEAVANITGVMKLDPGSTKKNPSVVKTSRPAIFWVMLEVSVFTALFGLAVQALPNLSIQNGDVSGPGESNIRDYMLKYMGDTFASNLFGPSVGHIFGIIVGIVFAVLLLSAVNTALVGLTSLLFLMSKDKEIPEVFQKLNSYGVPVLPAIVATMIPIVILAFVGDIAGLAELYAIGFIGAIATNLGSTSTDFSLDLDKKRRLFMFFTFLIMLAIELTLLIDKPNARNFAISVLLTGLILRSMVKEQREKQLAEKKRGPIATSAMKPELPVPEAPPAIPGTDAIACAVLQVGKTLRYALDESKRRQRDLYLLYIRVQRVISEEDRLRSWEEDPEAVKIFEYAKEYGDVNLLHFSYSVSDSPPDTIVDIVQKLGVTKLIMGLPRRSSFMQIIRGNILKDVSDLLPPEIDLIIVS